MLLIPVGVVQFVQRPFDVFAGAHTVGAKVEAGAKVVAGFFTAQRQAVGGVVFGVAHCEI